MKYFIRFGSGSIAPATLKLQVSKVESFLRINITFWHMKEKFLAQYFGFSNFCNTDGHTNKNLVE